MTMSPERRRAYASEKRKAGIPIYFASLEEKARYQALAKAEGASTFNAWVMQKLLAATSGTVVPAGVVEDLRAHVERYRSWIEQKDAEIAELRRDLRMAQAQRDDLRVVLAALSPSTSIVKEARARSGVMP